MARQLNIDDALLMVIDLQEKLLPAIHEGEAVVGRAVTLIRAARILDIPIVWTEQYKKGLGATDSRIADAIGDAVQPLEKICFGGFNDNAIARAAADSGRRQLILCGIEAHICVLQTALWALNHGWVVFFAQDAVGSRRPGDRETALARLRHAGAVPASVEMLVMEALGRAGTAQFKQILPLLK
jgi:nicotinamidase-related amidase